MPANRTNFKERLLNCEFLAAFGLFLLAIFIAARSAYLIGFSNGYDFGKKK